MRKHSKHVWFIILLMLLPIVFILPNSLSIGQHEPANGTVITKIPVSKYTYISVTATSSSGHSLVGDTWGNYWQTFKVNRPLYVCSVSVYGTAEASSNIIYARIKDYSDNVIATSNGTSLPYDGSSYWIENEFSNPFLLTPDGNAYKIEWMGHGISIYYSSSDYADGESDAGATDYCFKVYVNADGYNTTRVVGSISEINNLNVTALHTSSGAPQQIIIPVSNKVKAVTRVYNTSSGENFSEVSSLSNLGVDNYFFDAANFYVYLGVSNISSGQTLTYQVNCSYGATFALNLPSYLQVGDYFMSRGLIKDANGTPINGVIANTTIFYQNGTPAIWSEWNCTSGNYQCTMSTNTLTPGVYNVEVKFTDPDTGYTYKHGSTLYLSYTPTSGVYSDAVLYISWYNTNVGLGLPEETLKLYVDGERHPSKIIYTYIGATVNLTVKDFYNTTLYSNSFNITQQYNFIDLGLTFHSFLFGNKNDKYYIIGFLKQNATRWYERGITPMGGSREFLLPTGNYRLRIYDADYQEIYNQTVTVNRSMVYVIEGVNLSEIISGQSVIRGQLLELRSELNQATMPSVRKISVDLPYVYMSYNSVFDTPCFDAIPICPALMITATSENITTGNHVISHPLIPSSDNENGTVLILDDTIYLEGNSNISVNITYTDNGSVFSNTSYKPSYFLINGENLTINASSNLTVKRVTTYQQYQKFYWLYHTYTGLYETTVNVSNPLNTTVKKILVGVQVDNTTNPQPHTFRVYDVTNTQWLEEGVNFEYTGSFIKFWLPQLTPHQSRQFRIEYYATSEDITQTGVPIKVINTYTTKTLNNRPYYYFKAEWVNPNSVNFRGTLYIKLNFTTSYPIDPGSWIVFDRDNNRRLSSDEFIVSDKTVIISEDAVGVVAPGSSRTFDCYFYLETPSTTASEEHNWFLTPQVNILGVDITGLTLVLLIVFIGSIVLAFYDKNQSHWVVFALLLFLLSLYFTNM